jgi:hypothetical protein
MCVETHGAEVSLRVVGMTPTLTYLIRWKGAESSFLFDSSGFVVDDVGMPLDERAECGG